MFSVTRRKSPAIVVLNVRPVKGPWGGASAFAAQFAAVLERYGCEVRFDLRKRVDAIVIIDPRDNLMTKPIGLKEIKAYKDANPKVKILHRVNECDQRKGTSFMDSLLEETNEIADYTVFISSWLRDYFSARWFDLNKPNSLIYNGADPAAFHPIGSSVWREGETMKLVTHHWSDNPMKGFSVYKAIDDLIANGNLHGFELHVIGRWPKDIVWRVAKTAPAAHGRALAEQLRQCHLYVTASLWEPCGMHHVEGAQCGLPLIYHQDGGGIVEAGQKYGIGFKDDVKDVLVEARELYSVLRKRVLESMPNGDRMANEYAHVIQMMLAQR